MSLWSGCSVEAKGTIWSSQVEPRGAYQPPSGNRSTELLHCTVALPRMDWYRDRGPGHKGFQMKSCYMSHFSPDFPMRRFKEFHSYVASCIWFGPSGEKKLFSWIRFSTVRTKWLSNYLSNKTAVLFTSGCISPPGNHLWKHFLITVLVINLFHETFVELLRIISNYFTYYKLELRTEEAKKQVVFNVSVFTGKKRSLCYWVVYFGWGRGGYLLLHKSFLSISLNHPKNLPSMIGSWFSRHDSPESCLCWY